MRRSVVAFKTAEFYKRNFNRARSICSHTLFELRKMKEGFVNLKNDIMFYFGVEKKKI